MQERPDAVECRGPVHRITRPSPRLPTGADRRKTCPGFIVALGSLRTSIKCRFQAAFNQTGDEWKPAPGRAIAGKDGTGLPCYHRRGFPSLGRIMVILLTIIHLIVC